MEKVSKIFWSRYPKYYGVGIQNIPDWITKIFWSRYPKYSGVCVQNIME
jgi:hypothetical protein